MTYNLVYKIIVINFIYNNNVLSKVTKLFEYVYYHIFKYFSKKLRIE